MRSRRSPEVDRNLVERAFAWWEAAENRLAVIRMLFYSLFLLSIVGAIYGAIAGSLPPWGISLYAAFGIQLVFLTFMYAIRHASDEEARRALYELRRDRVPEWQFERRMLVELARFAHCQASGIETSVHLDDVRGRGRGFRGRRGGEWPDIPANEILRSAFTEALDKRGAVAAAAGDSQAVEPLAIHVIAYSSETLLEFLRDIGAGLASLSDAGKTVPRLAVKVLVRDVSPEAKWLVPLVEDERGDVTYADELRIRFRNARETNLREFKLGLEEASPGEVDFQVRGYRVEPLIKGITVDRSVGIFFLYTVDDLAGPQGWDYSGHWNEWAKADSQGAYFEQFGLKALDSWFNLLWYEQRLSREVTL